MQPRKQFWWPIGKAVLAVAILTAVGWHFGSILRRPVHRAGELEALQLWQQPLHWQLEWLAAAGLLYLFGLSFSAAFWYRLLVAVGERPLVTAIVRAYYFGHLGKYVPGKAWGLMLRTGLLVPSGIRPAVGAMTTTFETLTTIASGALVAAVLFALLTLDETAIGWSLVLLVIAALPIVPVVFNPLMRLLARLAGRAARRFGSDKDIVPLPTVHLRTLIGGVLLTSCGWGFLGLSLWAVLPEPVTWSWGLWGRCTAFVALSWVAGFLSFITPGGLGVREVILQRLLTNELRHAGLTDDVAYHAVIATLVIRLVWTAAELLMVSVVYWLPSTSIESKTSSLAV